jgi:hypothetical protein
VEANVAKEWCAVFVYPHAVREGCELCDLQYSVLFLNVDRTVVCIAFVVLTLARFFSQMAHFAALAAF